jgi:hypothetical protein
MGTLTYNVTGNINTPTSIPSGVVSGTSTDGWWMVEKQGLNLEYMRVPHFREFRYPYGEEVTLSSQPDAIISDVTGYSQTFIIVKITDAYYQKEKVNLPYTDGYIQPQTFKVTAHEHDHLGISYGALSANIMGPRGTIATDKEWYHRRPWNDATDVEMSYSLSAPAYSFWAWTPPDNGPFFHGTHEFGPDSGDDIWSSPIFWPTLTGHPLGWCAESLSPYRPDDPSGRASWAIWLFPLWPEPGSSGDGPGYSTSGEAASIYFPGAAGVAAIAAHLSWDPGGGLPGITTDLNSYKNRGVLRHSDMTAARVPFYDIDRHL